MTPAELRELAARVEAVASDEVSQPILDSLRLARMDSMAALDFEAATWEAPKEAFASAAQHPVTRRWLARLRLPDGEGPAIVIGEGHHHLSPSFAMTAAALRAKAWVMENANG